MIGWLCRRCAPLDPSEPEDHAHCDRMRGCECFFIRWDDDRQVFVLCSSLLEETP